MSQKTQRIIGWVLSISLGLLFATSAFFKLVQNETIVAQAAAVGFSTGTYRLIGLLEIVSLFLFLLPRTGLLGTLLLAAYMGGAIATHLQHGQPIVMAVAVQALLWIAATLRFPELRRRLLGSTQQREV